MKELERVKTEEIVRVDTLRSEMPLIYPLLNIDEPLVFIIDWLSILPISPFFPKLFADLRILDIVETFLDIRSSS